MSLLNAAYKELDFENGALYDAVETPSNLSISDWLDKGEWLAAAKRAGAEKVFFVENNPVIIFAECRNNDLDKIKLFNRIWCLARPRLLFLASPDEITVYDLAQKPINERDKKDWENLHYLDVLNDTQKVSEELQKYHRDHIESGHVFCDSRFGNLNNRADKALIRDLKAVRRELSLAGLSGENIRFAHALIGRSIFIRYLEDRGVLTEKYFSEVAQQKTEWTLLLTNSAKRTGINFSGHKTYYPLLLEDKEFTFALFRKLANDFNGDFFVDIDEEEKIIEQTHLKVIQNLLYGDTGLQQKLFFHAYRFDIIPLDLISSIYEEFYHSPLSDKDKKSKARQDGAYYTPPVLAEFVLSRILNEDILEKKPRILDPACGSGIFLVEAFRRIVRHRWHKKGAALSFDELKEILKNQIAGIEVNPEAANITAFSLYLSMLHYLDPPAIDIQIKKGNRLPNIVATNSNSNNNFHCILPENAFDAGLISANPVWRDRFGANCADVVVGNPPWGALGTKADGKAKERHRIMLDWCKNNGKPVGDREPSQAFLWRTLDFLKEGGHAGMLVFAGVLFNHSTTSKKFRKQWLEEAKLNDVFNFAHVRKVFFKGAVAPFISIFFSNSNQEDAPVFYWSAKRTIDIEKSQAVIFSKIDRRMIMEPDLGYDEIWKCLWWGNYSDFLFVRQLKNTKDTFLSVIDRKKSGRGFQVGSKTKDSTALQSFKTLKKFSRYDPLDLGDQPTDNVERNGRIDAYSGHRLLIQRGISQGSEDKGQIIARFETDSFCFTSAISGIKLSCSEEWKYKTALGILWSSLARYFFFMTSANWGLWHDAVRLDDELLQFPLIMDDSKPATRKIIEIVGRLRDYHPREQDVFHLDGPTKSEIQTKRRQWEAELDEAVFGLYDLTEEQKDLIRDCCEVTLPFYYQPIKSLGADPALEVNDFTWIEKYVHIFCRRWNAYLADGEEMRAEIHIGMHKNMVAIEFYPADKGDPWSLVPADDSWAHILEQIGASLPKSMGTSGIILDSIVQFISNDGIIIIKRNEKRFWTRTLAREDADATILKRMVDTMPRKEKMDN